MSSSARSRPVFSMTYMILPLYKKISTYVAGMFYTYSTTRFSVMVQILTSCRYATIWPPLSRLPLAIISIMGDTFKINIIETYV